MGRRFLLIAFISLFLRFALPVYAATIPTLATPTNHSTVNSNSLTWQNLDGSTNYRIQVDDQADFSSPNKDYNTTNLTYSPNLTEGQWYWRVKAKDGTDTWSDWSESWNFTITTATPSPNSSSSPTTDPTPTTTPTSSPDPSPSATTPPIGEASSEKFIVTNTPSTIHHDQNFTISVQLQNLNPNSKYYLKGAFAKEGSINYFGQTQVNGSWIINGANYSTQSELTTDNTGNWSGQLTIQPDTTDSGFSGIGNYIFKVARYNTTGSGPSWSNSFNITIDSAPTPSNSPSSTPTSSPTSNPSTVHTPIATTNTTDTHSDLDSPEIELPNLESSQTATVAGIQLDHRSTNSTTILDSYWYIIGGVGLLILGASPTLYLYLKPKLSHAIHYLKSRRD